MNVFRWTATIAALAASTATAQVQTAHEPGRRVFNARIVHAGEDGQVQSIIVGEDPDGGSATGQGIFMLNSSGTDLDVLIEPPPHWIGLGCGAATDALRTQLGLTDAGVVVFNVVENSPAAAAGFQKHDVLVKARIGDKEIPLRDTPDVIRAVQDCQLQPFQVEIIRAAKAQTLTVTPGDRPQVQPLPTNDRRMIVGEGGVVIDPERVRQLLSENKLDELRAYIEQRSQAALSHVRYRVAGPVVTMTPTVFVARLSRDLPENMTITITKTGKQPAQIKVQKGDDWWKATEAELDTFPEDIRGDVQILVHALQQGLKSSAAAGFPMHSYNPLPVPPNMPGVPMRVAPVVPAQPWPTSSIAPQPALGYQQQLEHQQKQLDAVLKQIEELKQSLEKLQPQN